MLSDNALRLAILVTEVVNSTFDRIRFGIYLDVPPLCSGAVLLACYGIWANLTALGPPTTTCLRDGGWSASLSYSSSIINCVAAAQL